MDTEQRSSLDVIGRRLASIGVIGAMVLGALWLLNSTGDSDTTALAIGFAVAAGVAVVGLVLQRTN